MQKHLIACFVLAGAAQLASASGFEKSIPFGGEAAGVAGIGTPYMQGSQALYYNPAGLVSDKVGQDVSLNISPTFPSWKAPTTSTNTQSTATDKAIFPFGLMYGKTLNDKWGFGVGAYVSSGLVSDYTNLSLGGVNGLEDKTDLTILEYAAGVGYKVNDNLKVGLSWRVVQLSGALDLAQPAAGGAGVEQINMNGLSATNYAGFKLGAQYKLGEKTELGFTYRSETTFKANGTQNIALNGNSVYNGSLTAGTDLPPAWTLGIANQCLDNWKFLGEYVFTQYSMNNNISTNLEGTSTPLMLAWKDETNIRLAAEYKGFDWPIRFGYTWTSQVTDNQYAYPTIAPPGAASTFTAGTGHAFGSFRADGGLEYSIVSGTANGVTASNELNLWALHLGGAYMF